MTQVDQSWGLFDHQFFNATGEDHFLESKANVFFTAPKMRFCSDLFLPKLAHLSQTAVLLQVQKAPQCPTATPSIIAKGPQQ